MDMMNKAKLDVLKQIRQIASKAMQDDMKTKGLKKVTVASDSLEGLEAGLEKAKAILDDKAEMAPDEYEEMMDQEAMPEMGEEEDLSSLEAQIKALEEKKAKLLRK